MQTVQHAQDCADADDGFLRLVLGELQSRVREDQYRAWFNEISLLDLQTDVAEFGVRSGFVRDWLIRNYLRVMEESVAAASGNGDSRRVKVSLTEPARNGAHDNGAHERTPIENLMSSVVVEPAPAPAPEPPKERPVEPAAPVLDAEADGMEAVVEGSGLNGNYTFEKFVVGECNRLSHAAALAIGENPGCAYNPLFIHGNVGLGKTHLLQATCQAILQKRRGARVAYLSCEDFTNRYIRAIQDGTLDEFRRAQRSVDVLVIDDIQFLAKKERTQEEFFHTFNALYNDQRQIVISSDRSPQQIPMIEERLVSRFKWGLVAEMEAPSLETRIAISKRKAKCLGVDMTDGVAHYIAERVDKNIRELEGAVIKVISVSQLTGQDLSTELASDALRGVVRTRSTPVTSSDIMSLITDEYSITTRDITGKGRTQTVSLPRQIAMFLTRKLTDLSLEEIGRNFGNRDHTTVLYAVQKIEKRIKDDRRFRETVDSLTSRLQGRTG